jgi:hypothetical protein
MQEYFPNLSIFRNLSFTADRLDVMDGKNREIGYWDLVLYPASAWKA